jgi:hypothetical protein
VRGASSRARAIRRRRCSSVAGCCSGRRSASSARFEALLARHPDRNLLVVLDNSDTSIRLGRWLLREHPTRIAAIYLRETVTFEAPPGLTPFVTAFDIARHEHAAGRLTAADARRVADAILAARSDADVIPTYAQCPTAPASCATAEPDLHDQCERLRERVQHACARRRGTGTTGR